MDWAQVITTYEALSSEAVYIECLGYIYYF